MCSLHCFWMWFHVNHYGWLTSKDMVAGLALGESTPGPLIMVNTFIGFVAGYNVGGNLAWGFLGAVIATLATFVPCFVLIISGAPIIDRIRSTGSFANSLNGITISVVGVIGGLAVFVARHALITRQRRMGARRARRGGVHRHLALPRRHHPNRAHCAAVGIINTLAT